MTNNSSHNFVLHFYLLFRLFTVHITTRRTKWISLCRSLTYNLSHTCLLHFYIVFRLFTVHISTRRNYKFPCLGVSHTIFHIIVLSIFISSLCFLQCISLRGAIISFFVLEFDVQFVGVLYSVFVFILQPVYNTYRCSSW